MTGNTSRRIARQAAESVVNGAGAAAVLAIGALAAYGVLHIAPSHWSDASRLLAAGTTGLAAAVLLDGLVWDAFAPLRRRLRPTAQTRPEPSLAPLHTLDDALSHLVGDVEDDAASRAALRAHRLDSADGLLRDERRWRGYPTGDASCYLAPGLTLYYQSDGEYEHDYLLLSSNTDQPVTITRLAQLHECLAARAGAVPQQRTA